MKGPRSRAWLLVLGVVCFVLWPAAAAGEPATGWYVNGGLGFCHLDQEESRNEEADLGLHLAAACGYRFNRWWALELETGLIRNGFPEEDGEDLGALTQVPLVLGAVVHFPNDTRFEPFLGGGGGLTLASTEEDSGGDVTLMFKGGVRYRMSERAAVGLDYTFFMLGATSVLAEEPVGSDTFNLSVRWMF